MPNMHKSKSHKTHSKTRSKSRGQKGGFTSHTTTPKPQPQKGGSPASSIVMADATMNPPVMNDYAYRIVFETVGITLLLLL